MLQSDIFRTSLVGKQFNDTFESQVRVKLAKFLLIFLILDVTKVKHVVYKVQQELCLASNLPIETSGTLVISCTSA